MFCHGCETEEEGVNHIDAWMFALRHSHGPLVTVLNKDQLEQWNQDVVAGATALLEGN